MGKTPGSLQEKPENWHNVLLAVVGLTPQVVTETLYYLTQVRRIPVHEICLVTTTRGAELARTLLFKEPDGALWRFCEDYGIRRDCIQISLPWVIQDRAGNPLDDIRTVEDNEAAGDFILRVVGSYTQNDQVRLFCSLAGGRKTMSTLAGFAMQLLARPHDELLHVLVRPPELESRRDFFYPPPSGDFRGFQPDGGELMIPREQIAVDCAEVPFVRLRNLLPRTLNPANARYSELIRLTQGKVDDSAPNVDLTLDLGSCKLTVTWDDGAKQIQLRPRQAALYAFFMANAGKRIASDDLWGQLGEINNFYSRIVGRRIPKEGLRLDPEHVRSLRSQVNARIAQGSLPASVAARCHIRSEVERKVAYYCLEADPTHCHILPNEPSQR